MQVESGHRSFSSRRLGTCSLSDREDRCKACKTLELPTHLTFTWCLCHKRVCRSASCPFERRRTSSRAASLAAAMRAGSECSMTLTSVCAGGAAVAFVVLSGRRACASCEAEPQRVPRWVCRPVRCLPGAFEPHAATAFGGPRRRAGSPRDRWCCQGSGGPGPWDAPCRGHAGRRGGFYRPRRAFRRRRETTLSPSHRAGRGRSGSGTRADRTRAAPPAGDRRCPTARPRTPPSGCRR